MAISQMAKFIIVSHRSEAEHLLEDIQGHGFCQILDAERSMVTKEWPELTVESKGGRRTQDIINRSQSAYDFGITGTPTSEIAGVRYPGVLPFDREDPPGIKQLLDAALEEAGVN